MALTVNLIGPSPWGFRIFGGRDFKKAITVSKVLADSHHIFEPGHTLSNHILCYCESTAYNGMSCKVNFLLTTSLFLSLFASMGCFIPISLTTEPVRMEVDYIRGKSLITVQWKLRWEMRGSWPQSAVCVRVGLCFCSNVHALTCALVKLYFSMCMLFLLNIFSKSL